MSLPVARHPQFTMRAGELTLTARCEASLADGARSLLAVVASFARRGHGLRGGVSLQFGWSRISIVEHGQKLRLHEPDFERGEGIRADLTASLRVARGQARIARATGLPPSVATCFQHVTIDRACLGERHLSMRRYEAASPDDTGWVISAVGAPCVSASSGEILTLPSSRLIRLRPSLLDVLSLPVGHEVVFDGDDVTELHVRDSRHVEAEAGAA